MRLALLAPSLLLLVACGAAPPPPAVAPPAPPPAAPAPPAKETQVASTAAMTREQALQRLFTADKASEAWFGAAFLAAVPVAKIDAIVGQIRGAGGALKDVQPEGKHFVVTFEKSVIEATVELDEEGRFTTLFVRPGEPKHATIDEAITAFRALPGKVSVLIESDGAERGSVEPALVLGVGSAFKLSILAALRAEIDGKKRAWKDVVELQPERRSLPSGFLQTWPDHAPMTVYSLAGLMISISDNTATDALLALVGREKVEAFAPRNKPFLATREMFQLKANGGEAELAAFQRGSEAEKRQVLKALEKKPLPAVEGYPTEPRALDVEWFYSARELCALMKKVHDLPVMGINPGLAKKADWDHVSFKGGSEPGVLSMTTWLSKGPRAHCISAIWNAPHKLDEGVFVNAYAKAIAALKN